MSLKKLLPAATLLALIGTSASAQDLATLQKACTNDIKTLCAGIEPGGGRIRQCMVAKREQASPECKAAMNAVAEAAGGAPPK